MQINNPVHRKLITVPLLITILCASTPSYSLHPRNYVLIGCAAGIIAGSWIGYKASKPTVTTKSPKTFTEKIKQFIKEYPILCGGTIGAVLGATSVFGLSQLIATLQRNKPSEVDTFRNELKNKFKQEIALRKQQTERKLRYWDIEQVDYNNAMHRLDNCLANATRELEQQSSINGMKETTNRILTEADKYLAQLERDRITQRQHGLNNNLQPYNYQNPWLQPNFFQPQHPVPQVVTLPATKNVLQKLPKEQVQTAECFQCMDTKNNTRIKYCLNCAAQKNPWCEDCIKGWLTAHNTCPICQKQI